MVPVRLCSVSFRDVHGVYHTINVHAESVLEAAALGVREIQKTGILDDEGAFDITVDW